MAYINKPVSPDGQIWTTQAASPAAYAPTVVPPAPSIVQQPYRHQIPTTVNYGVWFNRAAVTGLGVVVIFAGVIAFVGGVVAIPYLAHFHESGIGIWSGAMCAAAGSVSIAAGQYRTYSMIKAATGTVAAAVGCSVILLILGSIGVVSDLHECYYYWDFYCEQIHGMLAANSLLIAGAAIVFTFGTALLVICARALRSMKKMKLKYAGPVNNVVQQQCVNPVQNFIPVQYTYPNAAQNVIPTQYPSQVQSINPVQYANPVQNVTPVQYASPAQNVTPVQYASPAQNVIPVQYASPAQNVIPVQYASPAQNVIPVQYASPAQNVIPVQYASPAQNVTPVQYANPVQNSIPVQYASPVQTGTPMQLVAPTSDEVSVKLASPVQNGIQVQIQCGLPPHSQSTDPIAQPLFQPAGQTQA